MAIAWNLQSLGFAALFALVCGRAGDELGDLACLQSVVGCSESHTTSGVVADDVNLVEIECRRQLRDVRDLVCESALGVAAEADAA